MFSKGSLKGSSPVIRKTFNKKIWRCKKIIVSKEID